MCVYESGLGCGDLRLSLGIDENSMPDFDELAPRRIDLGGSIAVDFHTQYHRYNRLPVIYRDRCTAMHCQTEKSS